MKTLPKIIVAAIATATFQAGAQSIPVMTSEETDNTANALVPERAIILTGGENGINREVMAVLYDTKDLDFHDPNAPRFLLIDKKGTTVFGIGGYAEGIVQYDFAGAIDNSGFDTYDIAVPSNPALRSQLGADATHTTLFMQLVTHTKWGVLTAYAQGNFTNQSYGFKLKQAYIKLNNVTAGLARSSFVDALSGVPTIDYQGPSGAMTGKNLLVQYRKEFVDKHLVAAISAEMPSADYTQSASNEAINQRVPDIPAYIQYQWGGGKSHVRASAIVRNLSYRDLATQENKFRTGWGAQLSGAVKFPDYATVYYQATYGKGIARYINDLSGSGYDLITDANGGGMKAPGSLALVGGLRFDISKRVFVSGSYSLCRLYDQENLGADAYRRANYAVVNCFWTPIDDLQFGIEYLHGQRTNMDGSHGSANRLEAMVKYSF